MAFILSKFHMFADDLHIYQSFHEGYALRVYSEGEQCFLSELVLIFCG
jgi:hypothetical protein